VLGDNAVSLDDNNGARAARMVSIGLSESSLHRRVKRRAIDLRG
jgi:hypothetical protein